MRRTGSGRRGSARTWARRRRALPLLALLALPACGLLGGGRAPAVPVNPADDLRIRREVEARLAAEPSLRSGQLRAEVKGSTVSLYGNVVGLGALQCAMTNAGLVSGVTNVIDFMVLQNGPRDVRCLAPRTVRSASADSAAPTTATVPRP
ncbi:MAG: BON domain-containing protein [Gemmatimonadetes bacterium]|nr:BON domain-containing protein [Gemmatimonadota bacterium]